MWGTVRQVAEIPTSRMRVDDAPLPTRAEPAALDAHSEVTQAIQDNIFNGESLDAVFRGEAGGLGLLAVTNKRLMLLDEHTFEQRTALTSVPLKGISKVSFVPLDGETLDTTRTVGVVVGGQAHLVICPTRQEARELHDMLIWTLMG